jgi:hypothetical protein
MVKQARADLGLAERRLAATEDALASVPADASADAMLDFANALQAATRGRLDHAHTMAEVNLALRELFERFLLDDLSGGEGLFHRRPDPAVAGRGGDDPAGRPGDRLGVAGARTAERGRPAPSLGRAVAAP